MRKLEIVKAIEKLKSERIRINRRKIAHEIGIAEKTVGNNWDDELEELLIKTNNEIGYPIYKSDIEGEEFRNIQGFDGYQVSNLGRIISLIGDKPKFRSQNYTRNGYLMISMSNKRSVLVHQLVAIAFLDHTPNRLINVIDHINGIKDDNRLVNLRIVSIRENTSFGYNKKETTSKYRGVFHRKDRKSCWSAHIRINSKRIYLGHYKTEEEAHNVYQKTLNDYLDHGIIPMKK